MTAAAGSMAGGLGAYYFILPNIDISNMSSADGLAISLFTVFAPAATSAAASWITGAVYSAKKWYNTYKASKYIASQAQSPDAQ